MNQPENYRTWQLSPPLFSRIWRGLTNLAKMIGTPLQTLYKTEYENKTFGFDFSTTGEVIEGDTLLNPIIYLSPNDSSLTISTPPYVNTSTFYDGRGGAEIQPGQGILLKLNGGSPTTTYTVYCRVTTSSGDDIEIQGLLQVNPSIGT